MLKTKWLNGLVLIVEGWVLAGIEYSYTDLTKRLFETPTKIENTSNTTYKVYRCLEQQMNGKYIPLLCFFLCKVYQMAC
jgi:hypothetical protein